MNERKVIRKQDITHMTLINGVKFRKSSLNYVLQLFMYRSSDMAFNNQATKMVLKMAEIGLLYTF